MKIAFSRPSLPASGAYVVGVAAGRKLTPSARQLDQKTRGRLSQAIKASRFKGAKNQALTLLAPAGIRLDRVLVVGLGKPADIDAIALQGVGGRIYAALGSAGVSRAVVAVDGLDGCSMAAADMAAALPNGPTITRMNALDFR